MTLRAPMRDVIIVKLRPMLPCPITTTFLPRRLGICWQEYNTVPEGWHIIHSSNEPSSGSRIIRPGSETMYSTRPAEPRGGMTMTRCPS